MKERIIRIIKFLNEKIKKIIIPVYIIGIVITVASMAYIIYKVLDQNVIFAADLFYIMLAIIFLVVFIVLIIKSFIGKSIKNLNNLQSNWKDEIKTYKKVETPNNKTYTEWIKHLKDNYSNTNNLYIYLKNQYRFNKSWIDIIKTIMLPTLLVIVSAFSQLEDSGVISIELIQDSKKITGNLIYDDTNSVIFQLILISFVMFLCIKEIANSELENDFIQDFFNIVFSEKTDIKKIEKEL